MVDLSINITGPFNARTWILGDSIAYWAGTTNQQLRGGGEVLWLGRRGANLSRIMGIIRRNLRRQPFPTTIIIHVGTNDIFDSSTLQLRARIPELVRSVRHILPRTRIIWSDVLDRLFYYGEAQPGAGRRVGNFINSQAHRAIYELGRNAHFISYRGTLDASTPAFYRRDGVHLNDAGNIMFRMVLAEGLVFFNTHPGSTEFPPQ